MVPRFRCSGCKRGYSNATFHPCYGQKKRHKNFRVYQLLCSGVSLRRTARLLHLHRTTVERKLRFLAAQCRLSQKQLLEKFRNEPLSEIFFDEMESFEHTKLKPLSLPIAVTRERIILSAKVARMPAKGLLAAPSRKKYGFRKDERPRALREMLHELVPLARSDVTLHSDQNPHYPRPVKKFFPEGTHMTTPGGRGAVVGQGELKKLTWDPLFPLNHSAAMLRANMSRLFRRTWNTTKIPRGLEDHQALYIHYHNTQILQR